MGNETFGDHWDNCRLTIGGCRASTKPMQGLDSQCQLWPSDSKAEIERNRNSQVGEAVAQIPDEGMPTNDDVGRRFLLEATHGIQPLFEMSMVAFNAVVEILRGPMLNSGED